MRFHIVIGKELLSQLTRVSCLIVINKNNEPKVNCFHSALARSSICFRLLSLFLFLLLLPLLPAAARRTWPSYPAPLLIKKNITDFAASRCLRTSWAIISSEFSTSNFGHVKDPLNSGDCFGVVFYGRRWVGLLSFDLKCHVDSDGRYRDTRSDTCSDW